MKKTKSSAFSGDVSCVICGAAGQGIQTIERIIPQLMKLAGYNVFATKEYMSRVRGGSNSTEIRISSKRVSAYVDRIDILIPLDKDAIPHVEGRISGNTVVIGDKTRLGTDRDVTDVPFSKIAAEVGGAIYENVVAAGVLAGVFGLDAGSIDAVIRKIFAKKAGDIITNNINAARQGHEIGAGLRSAGSISIDLKPGAGVRDELLIEGSEAIAMGAIAGGCNFISAYPMTPSTGIFTFLTQHADEFGIVSEQAEDEIAAINMMLGAWYAGARAMVTTSGGGFDLMTEGLSLAGMIESPAVISLGQRPGPATGLPTRTEQGDLELALYAGHGEFPRAIYTPGTLQDAFELTRKAFDTADRYQVPVFVMSDQFLVDSLYNVPAFRLADLKTRHHFIETTVDYRRYAITKNGVSPRGIPGFGPGLVGLDSDEHDEDGHITEDLKLRTRMTDKRLRKLDLLKKAAIPPRLIGSRNYRTLIVGWGSTYSAIVEALERSGRKDTAFLYFRQVWPLHLETAGYLKKARRTILVENNAAGQFGRLIRQTTGVDIGEKVLKYNGLPFSVEEVLAGIGTRR